MIENIAILIVSRWSSECSHCGKNADPSELRHEMAKMEGEGCGARFVAQGQDYDGPNAVINQRSDLPFIDIYVNKDEAVRLPPGFTEALPRD